MATTFTILHTAADFSLRIVTVSAESVGGSSPGARVTWSTTLPPECVAFVTVKFRTTNSGSAAVRTYMTTNTSETEVIQTGLQCDTTHFTRVVVNGVGSLGSLQSSEVGVFVGGKVTMCVISSCTIYYKGYTYMKWSCSACK